MAERRRKQEKGEYRRRQEGECLRKQEKADGRRMLEQEKLQESRSKQEKVIDRKNAGKRKEQ